MYDGHLESSTKFRDKAVIRTETEVIELNINYNPTKADVFIKGDLDFGLIAHESIAKKELYLVNQGDKEGSFKVILSSLILFCRILFSNPELQGARRFRNTLGSGS